VSLKKQLLACQTIACRCTALKETKTSATRSSSSWASTTLVILNRLSENFLLSSYGVSMSLREGLLQPSCPECDLVTSEKMAVAPNRV
jgi:hypothetical protein